MGVGMPHALYLHEFGSHVYAAFGEMPYHVGSSLIQKTGWRDVDVRLILPDDAYELWGFGKPNLPHHSGKWVAFCMAFSVFGRHLTGLPIDFQIQQQSQANTDFPDQLRSALGVTPLRLLKRKGDD